MRPTVINDPAHLFFVDVRLLEFRIAIATVRIDTIDARSVRTSTVATNDAIVSLTHTGPLWSIRQLHHKFENQSIRTAFVVPSKENQ